MLDRTENLCTRLSGLLLNVIKLICGFWIGLLDVWPRFKPRDRHHQQNEKERNNFSTISSRQISEE